MEFRTISLEVVMSILINPQQILTEEGKKVYQSIINFGEEGDYLVRVFVNIEKDPNHVITVYRTSKITKYYEG
jgi:Domain of unknown function (DUF4258)